MPPQTSVCRQDAPTDLCLQTRSPPCRPRFADPMLTAELCLQSRWPQRTSVWRTYASTTSTCRLLTPQTSLCGPDATQTLSLDWMPPETSVCRPYAPSEPLCADPMTAQTSVCRPDAPTDRCMQTRCPRRVCLSTRCPRRPLSPNLMHP